MEAQGKDTRTLEEALKETAQRQWQGRRCYATNSAQALKAATDVAHFTAPERNPGMATVPVSAVTPAVIRRATASWYAQGLAPATINKRLNCLSAMGVSVEGCRVREPRALKWWLKPVDEARALAYLRTTAPVRYAQLLSDLIPWTTRTGLRIEESLRLRWSDLSLGEAPAVTVPGLKTATAQATLPLSAEALAVIREAAAWRQDDDGPFAIDYYSLEAEWSRLRRAMGWPAGATLKALRRSAARHLHVTKGMPLDVVRQYLRHEKVETTMGYLRLTGGYGTEEMRRWL